MVEIHEAERGDRRGRRLTSLSGLLVVCLLVSSWVGLFGFLSVEAASGTLSDLDQRYLPDPESLELALPDLSRVSRIHTEDGTVLAELHDGRVSEPVPLEEIPRQVVDAVLAAEDAEFYEHEGIDFQAIARAALSNVRGGNLQGGSTITQQLVKQNFVGDEQSIERKVKEAVISAELERRFTKDELLEHYLNSVYFGWGAYGVKAAAREFFAKGLSRLTLAEAATLATFVRSPAIYDPRRDPDLVLERRRDVLGNMVAHGMIDREEAERAAGEPLGIADHRDFQEVAPHLVAEVKRQLLHEEEFSFLGDTYAERKRAVFGCPANDPACHGGGGLRITITLDLELQQLAQNILTEWFPNGGGTAPTGAIASVDPGTGAVLVMASGLPFDEEQYDLTTQGRRNPGSAFKPFALVAALESGVSMRSFWDSSSPIRIDCGYPCGPGGSHIWTVRNAGGGGGGLISLYDATVGSVNAVFAQVAVAVGPEKIVEVAHRMGIESDLPSVYSLTLGSGAVTPLEMASAFGSFATNGLHATPYLISRIENAAGEVLYEHHPEARQVIDPGLAAARTALEQVVARGTATRAKIGRPQAGKTGTHQDYRDAWFIGFVPQMSTAVWMGFPDAQIPLRGVVVKGVPYSRVYGGSIPAPIWKQFMEAALVDQPAVEFPQPGEDVGEYFRVPLTTVPSVYGLSSGAARRALLQAHLRPIVEEVRSPEPEGTVVGQSHAAGSRVAQGTGVAIQVSVGPPPSAPLPDLVGLTLAEADASLRAFASQTGVSLGYGVSYQPTDRPDLVDRVITTQPGAGVSVTEGATVTLVVGQEPPSSSEGEGSGDGGPGGG